MEKLTGTYNVVNGNMTSSRQQDAGFAGRIGQAAEIRDSGSVIRYYCDEIQKLRITPAT